MTESDRVGRLALIDRILAALADGPTSAEILCVRVGTVNCWCPTCRGGFRRARPVDLVDALDALALSGAIKGDVRHVGGDQLAPRTIIVWRRLLARDELASL